MKNAVFALLMTSAACAPKPAGTSATPAPAAPAVAIATAAPSSTDASVRFRDRTIDLTPFIQGFPYKNFTPDYDSGRFFYMHEGADSMQMMSQPMPSAGGEIDVTKGTAALTPAIDWAKRSFWGMEHHPSTTSMILWGDEKNDEVTNLFKLSLADGSLTRVTDKPYIYGFGLDAKKARVAFLPRYGTSKDAQFKTCLTMLDWATAKEEELLCDETAEFRFTWTHVLWRPDSSGVILEVNRHGDRAQGNIGWFDFTTKKLTPLLDAKKARNIATTLDEWIDPTRFLYVSDETGFTNVFVYDLKTKSSTQVTRFDEELGSWAPLVMGQKVYAAVIIKRPSESELVVVDPLSRETVFTERMEENAAIIEHHDEKMYVVKDSVKTSLLVEEWFFRPAPAPLPAGATVAGLRLVKSAVSRVRPPAELAAKLERCNVERVSFPTFDTDTKTKKPRQLHAYLFTPKAPPDDPKQRFALITSFYGGENVFDTKAQIVCAAGGMSLSPAVRGSDGFGRDFFSLNDKDLGGDEIVDVMYGGRYLAKRFGLEEKQIGVWGGSHGGYATMRAMTFPEIVNGRKEAFDFGFGLSHAGFSNILTFYETCNIPDWVKLEAGDPVKERAKLLDRSPVSHVARLKRPILLTHGENDNRVPVAESRQFAAKAKELGKPVTYVEFSGQGHGLKGIPNQKTLWQARFAFLEGAIDGAGSGTN